MASLLAGLDCIIFRVVIVSTNSRRVRVSSHKTCTQSASLTDNWTDDASYSARMLLKKYLTNSLREVFTRASVNVLA